jgi:hypothetical protein
LQGPVALAQAQRNLAPTAEPAGEANLHLPDLSSVDFLGISGHSLLLIGLIFCVLGLLFGLAIYLQLKNLPVHSSMREISELIYETCKTYLVTQGKFLAVLWIFIAVIMAFWLQFPAIRWLSPFLSSWHSASWASWEVTGSLGSVSA